MNVPAKSSLPPQPQKQEQPQQQGRQQHERQPSTTKEDVAPSPRRMGSASTMAAKPALDMGERQPGEQQQQQQHQQQQKERGGEAAPQKEGKTTPTALQGAPFSFEKLAHLSTQERLKVLNDRMDELRRQYKEAKRAGKLPSEMGAQATPENPNKRVKYRPRLAPKDINALHQETLARVKRRLQAHLPSYKLQAQAQPPAGPMTRSMRRGERKPPVHAPTTATNPASTSASIRRRTRGSRKGSASPKSPSPDARIPPTAKEHKKEESGGAPSSSATAKRRPSKASKHRSASIGDLADISKAVKRHARSPTSPHSEGPASPDTVSPIRPLDEASSSQVAGKATKAKRTSRTSAGQKRAGGPRSPKTKQHQQQPQKQVQGAASVSTSPQASSHGKASEEEQTIIYRCPWPNCHKTFRRIKSRSAHLKWHGGDYRSPTSRETSGSAGPGSPTAAGVTTAAASSQNPVCWESMYPGDVFTFNERCTDRQLQGKACSFVKHAQEEGEQVAVMHVHRTTPLRIVQVKDLSVLNRRDADEVHSDTPSEAESTQSSYSFSPGQVVLQERSEPDGCVYYERAIVETANQTGERAVTAKSMHSASVDTLAAVKLIPDTSVTHTELTLGMRVLSAVDDREHVLWPGTVHRIEPTRARVNFDSKPLRWKKASALRLARHRGHGG